MRGFVVDRSRDHRFSTPHEGRIGEACFDGTIAAGPNLAKGASHVGRVSKPRTPDHQGALSPEVIEDNGDSIIFTSRRDYTSYVLSETEREIVIAYGGERNTVVAFCITKSPELAATCLTVLARDGIATLTDMSYTPRDLLGPAAHGIQHFDEVPTPVRSHLDYRSHGIRDMPIIRMRSCYRRGFGPLPGFTAAVKSRQSIAHAEEE